MVKGELEDVGRGRSGRCLVGGLRGRKGVLVVWLCPVASVALGVDKISHGNVSRCRSVFVMVARPRACGVPSSTDRGWGKW